jgi:C4-dicarboxylate transporter DctM subunit
MMEWYEVGLSLMGLLMLLIFIGLPIPFAMAAAALPFLLNIQGLSTSIVSTELKLWGVWIDYILLSVPLFVFLGELIGRSNIGPNLYRFMHNGIPIRGSAAYGSIGACAGFGAVCGSSMVGSLTIGGVALPEMIKLGYDRRLTSGVLAAGGTLSVLLPPSLILLFYGIVTDQSIGRLFMAGVIPGLLLASLFVLVIVIWARLYPAHVPAVEQVQRWSKKAILMTIGPVILIGAIITISIYAGIATPTEAAAVAAAVTLLLAFWVGGLTKSAFIDSIMATMRTMGYLGFLLSAGVLFGFVMNYYQIPQQFTSYFLAFDLSPFVVLMFVIAFYIIIGMFLEPVSMTFITLPTIYPLIAGSGYDLIWFGVIYTITMEIAVLTPPVGLNLFVIQGIGRKHVSIGDVIIGSLPFIAMMIVLLVVMILLPQTALWLPELMK